MVDNNRRKIALVLPMRFSVRAFLMTDIFTTLKRDNDLLLISPFAENESFRTSYPGPGIQHAQLLDFHPTGHHLRWYNLLQKAVKRKRNLEADKVMSELLAYHDNYKKDSLLRSRTWRLLRSLFYSRWIATSAMGLNWLRHQERAAFEEQPNHDYYEAILLDYQPDLVVSTSPNRPPELPLARAVEKLGIPHLAYILSFDNICCYDEYPVIYDHYMVWNERNRQELMHQHPVLEKNAITICGPLQFDFYNLKQQYLVSRKEWAETIGMTADQPIVLYAETGHTVAPHEPAVVADLADRIRTSNVRPSPRILVRTHPMYHPGRWDAIRQQYPEVTFSSTNLSRGQRTTLGYDDHVDWEERDLALLINTLHHSDVHWNVSSTMTLDAAYFDRPVVCVAYDPRPGQPFGQICRRLYDRDHYSDITESGGAVIAETPEEAWHATQIYLDNPALYRNERQKVLGLYDPFMDGQATQRVAQVILKALDVVGRASHPTQRKGLLRRANLLSL